MSYHAWCKDVSRDEAVRAAEDGRIGPLPPLEDAIAQPFADQDKCSPSLTETDRLRADADHLLSLIHDQTKGFAEVLAVVGRIDARVERLEGMIPKSVSATSAPEPENKGNGMRTERVTLEITHHLDEPLGDWVVQVIDESLGFSESVCVVEEANG